MSDLRSTVGRIYDIQGFSVHDGPGIRTTVYTKGCPLHCLWCHSPESIRYEYDLSFFDMRCIGTAACGSCLSTCPNGAISPAEAKPSVKNPGECISKVQIDRTCCTGCLQCTTLCPPKALTPSGYETTAGDVFDRILRDKPFFGTDGGVTVSGGEPMMQFPFSLALARLCREADISVCLDTTGFAPWEHYAQILPFVDLFLFDLKQMNSEKHRKLTGVPNEQILNNARLLASHGGKLQIRIPTIPLLNATPEHMDTAAQLCCELGDAVSLVQLLPYHNMGAVKYERIGKPYPLTRVSPPSDEAMEEWAALFRSYGLPVQIH